MRYLASENDDPNRGIIPGVSESTHELLHRLGTERVPSLGPINTYLQLNTYQLRCDNSRVRKSKEELRK